MRRLPIFLLLDVSESMVGDSLHQLEEAVSTIVRTLRQDPYALETVHISVIVFAGKARTIIPLVELITFYPPELPVGGGTSLGGALNHLMDEIDRTVAKSSPQRKGDWRPLVFLLTDGHPTDETRAAVQRWNRDYRSRASLVAVSIGGQADHAVLRELTDDVVVFLDSTPDSFKRFATWVTQSIVAQSRSVSAGADGAPQLPKGDPALTALEDRGSLPSVPASLDERFVVLVGRCQDNGLPYLIKYERRSDGSERTAWAADVDPSRRYALVSAVPLKNTYFDLSDERQSTLAVNSSDLVGQPDCPHCSAPYSVAACSCGGIHCLDESETAVCPWCHQMGSYGSSGGSGGFDIGRGLG